MAPVLRDHCLRCHEGAEPKGDLDLSRAEAVGRRSVEDGIIVPGRPGASRLIREVSGDDPGMPRSGDPLTGEEVEALRRWIARGARWPEGLVLEEHRDRWWSLEPLRRPALPELSAEDRRWARTPVDAFIIAKLRERGLSPAREAGRRTLVRRLYFDLTGLPPTPGEVEEFVGDPGPRAYERLVERLLQSPRYGERWARHWLDVAHYGDTHGFDKDKLRPHAWPYRDYVIRAFNEDKPYSRFVEEQLAGDFFYPDTRDGITALGFIAAGPWDYVGQVEVRPETVEKRRVRNLDRDDMVATTMNAFVSLTVQCARCHDHKFDPISQEDYYSLQAVFAAVDRADRPYDPDPHVAERRHELKQRRTELRARKSELERQIAERLGPEGTRIERRLEELRRVDGIYHGKRPDGVRKELARLERQRSGLLRERVDAELRRRKAELRRDLRRVESRLQALPERGLVYAAASRFPSQGNFRPTGGEPRPVHLLARGSVKSPLHEVEPGTLSCLPELEARFDLGPGYESGERRAALAEWIVDPRNPLTWRSIVNRVWHYHFGRGIVDSPSDFGRMGSRPTHPKLLDWLAVEFRDGGQSLKELHRLIVTSAVYRQASEHDAGHAEIDSGNRFLWRMNRRRLQAEAIRDAVLAASGKLEHEMGGPAFKPFEFEDDHSPHYYYARHDPDDPASHRRSVYRFIVRSVPDPFMEALDCADPSLTVAKRNQTLTALQALALLNDEFMVRMAEHFARRLRGMAADVPGRIEAAYRWALSRSPTKSELRALVPLAREYGMASVCRLIFNTNEFIYVD